MYSPRRWSVRITACVLSAVFLLSCDRTPPVGPDLAAEAPAVGPISDGAATEKAVAPTVLADAAVPFEGDTEMESHASSYTVGAIPFAPYTGSLPNAGPTFDDQVLTNRAIGFSFEFWGHTYTTFDLSSNGLIGFGGSTPSTYTPTAIPNTGSPNNMVAIAWTDLDPSKGGSISWGTVGSAPNRRLIVRYQGVAFYSGAGNVTVQAILYEGSNLIEIHATSMPLHSSYRYTQGVENANGTLAVAPTGRNNQFFSLSNDAIRFTPVAIDNTPPVISHAITGTLGTNNWYTTNVAVNWSATDPESSITSTSGCGQGTVTADTGPGGITFTCTATSAGGTASQSVTIRRDASPPVITPMVTGPQGPGGHYTGDVTVSWSVQDPHSGIAGSSGGCQGVTIPHYGTQTSVTCSAVNGAGLQHTETVTILRDPTPPVITGDVAGTLGSNGWFTSDVLVTWSVLDPESPTTSPACTAGSVTTDTDASGTTFTCIATSAGGTTSQSVTVKRDASAPAVSGTPSGTQGAGGWYTGNVTITWSTSDPQSGASSCAAVTHTTDTGPAGETYSCTSTNGAGLSTTASVTVKRDASPPTVTPTVTGTSGANGWFTSPVTVSWSTSDAQSGASTCAAATQSSDTGGETFTCTSTNGAGLSTTASTTVKKDGTAPVITFSGATGYTVDQTVAITCSATDATSGIASASCPGASGDAHDFDIGATTLNASATDNAGNSSTASVSFTVSVTSASLCALVERWVDQRGVATSMCQQLRNGAIGAFINHVQAQSGKSVSEADAAKLIELARKL